MGFEVIPAIDVAGGRLARMGADGPVAFDGAFEGDPVAAAEAFVGAGVGWLHVVDLDLAYTGDAANLSLLRRIAALPVSVQASGGVVGRPEVEELLDAGAARVVMGSGALGDRVELEALAADLGERVAVGVEVEGERVRPRGRTAAGSLALEDVLELLRGSSIKRLVVTSVERVGELSGPDVATPVRVAQATGLPVIAAGGIASIEDVRSLAATGKLEGAIVGRAALAGALDVRAAVASARG